MKLNSKQNAANGKQKSHMRKCPSIVIAYMYKNKSIQKIVLSLPENDLVKKKCLTIMNLKENESEKKR